MASAAIFSTIGFAHAWRAANSLGPGIATSRGIGAAGLNLLGMVALRQRSPTIAMPPRRPSVFGRIRLVLFTLDRREGEYLSGARGEKHRVRPVDRRRLRSWRDADDAGAPRRPCVVTA